MTIEPPLPTETVETPVQAPASQEPVVDPPAEDGEFDKDRAMSTIKNLRAVFA
jgi:hypothetical protein